MPLDAVHHFQDGEEEESATLFENLPDKTEVMNNNE